MPEELRMRGRLEVDDETRQVAIVDLGKLSLIERALKERIQELKPGWLRSLGRFVFRHPSWADDQYWLERQRSNLFQARYLAGMARLVLVGEVSRPFYERLRDMGGIDLIRGDAFSWDRNHEGLYELTRMDNFIPLEPLLAATVTPEN